MARNPHWDEDNNNFPTYGPPSQSSQVWSPEKEYGNQEFSGWRSQEDPPSYRSDWQDYSADEFRGAGIQPRGQWNDGPVGSGITSLGENYVSPPWWETQMGGKAYGPFHKSGSIYDAPQDYPGLMKLEPGQNYSYLDLAGNPMLNQSEWSEYSPYRRSNPLIQDLSGMAGSQVPDELLFEDIGDGNFKWNPWQSEDVINARHWLPEEYSIDPGIDQFEDVFQFRKFPWMED
jgi:hypothetical protein